MGLSRPRFPRTRPGLIGLAAGIADKGISRAVGELERAVSLAERRSFQPVALTGVDLAIGSNTLEHGLGRAPAGVLVVPTALGADWCWVPAIPHADRLVRVDLSGVALPGATVVVF